MLALPPSFSKPVTAAKGVALAALALGGVAAAGNFMTLVLGYVRHRSTRMPRVTALGADQALQSTLPSPHPGGILALSIGALLQPRLLTLPWSAAALSVPRFLLHESARVGRTCAAINDVLQFAVACIIFEVMLDPDSNPSSTAAAADGAPSSSPGSTSPPALLVGALLFGFIVLAGELVSCVRSNIISGKGLRWTARHLQEDEFEGSVDFERRLLQPAAGLTDAYAGSSSSSRSHEQRRTTPAPASEMYGTAAAARAGGARTPVSGTASVSARESPRSDRSSS